MTVHGGRVFSAAVLERSRETDPARYNKIKRKKYYFTKILD